MTNSVYNLPSTEQSIKWMHAVCGYPVISTWLKAIAAGNFIGWSLLTVQNIKKYYLEMTETPKGHLNQMQKNVWLKKIMETSNTTTLKGKKARDVGQRVSVDEQPQVEGVTQSLPKVTKPHSDESPASRTRSKTALLRLENAAATSNKVD